MITMEEVKNRVRRTDLCLRGRPHIYPRGSDAPFPGAWNVVYPERERPSMWLTTTVNCLDQQQAFDVAKVYWQGDPRPHVPRKR